MANSEHIAILRQGSDIWNRWRKENPDVQPDFSGADLRGIDLYFRASLEYADFSGADLREAILDGAILLGANLQKANLSGASLRKVRLKGADLRDADLSNTNLHRARVNEADMRGTNLTGARFDVVTASHAKLHGAKLENLYYIKDTYSFGEVNTSIFDLSMADGLDELDPSSEAFLLEYLSDAFKFAHRSDTEEAEIVPKYVEKALQRIRVLLQIYSRGEFTTDLINVIQLINAELITFLKKHPEELHKLSWRAFEELIAELLSAFGWEVQLTQPSKDNGYDIFGIYKDISGTTHSWIIECKKWAKDRLVGVDIARSLYGVKTDLRVGGAMLATTSNFTQGVRDFKASRYDFELRGYEEILNWINTYRPNSEGKLYIKDNKLILPGDKQIRKG